MKKKYKIHDVAKDAVMLILQWFNYKSPCFRILSPYWVYFAHIWHKFHIFKYFTMEQGN